MSPPATPAGGGWHVLDSAADTAGFGRVLAGQLRAGDVVLLVGELGAGKTTLAQGLGEGLGVRGPVTSPTFVIARVHPSLAGGPALVHVDAYRLGDATELDDLDLDAELADAVTVVEWGRGVAEALSDSYLQVELIRLLGGDPTGPAGFVDPSGGPTDPRRARVTGHGPRWAAPEVF